MVPTASIRHLMIFFGVAGCAQGITGLLSHPLTYYLKSIGLGADEVNQALALAAVPWIVKPFYGLITDFIPLFGYRRKSYLLLAFLTATTGYLWLTQLLSPGLIIGMVGMTTIGVAAADVILDALLVEQGQRTGLLRAFQGQQWAWVNVSAIIAALLGGWLTSTLDPADSLHVAAGIIVIAPTAVCLLMLRLIPEEKARHQREHYQFTKEALCAAISSRAFWTVAGFLVAWNMVPRFTTPLYYHMMDHLQFDQYFFGQLNAIGAIGAAIGALIYKKWLIDRFSSLQLVVSSVALTTIVTLGHLWLVNPHTALLIYFVGGIVSMVSLLTLFALAAMASHPSVAAFSFATLMACYSGAGQCGSIIGGYLYEHVFQHHMSPLIWLAAAVTMMTTLWIPFLPRTVLACRASGTLKDQPHSAAQPTPSRSPQQAPYMPQVLST